MLNRKERSIVELQASIATWLCMGAIVGIIIGLYHMIDFLSGKL